ncbi:MAG: ATP:cob(I)alamin adenosyltransferase [Pirellulales bacterium]|nr:ATP:cob(I)alamin adenosyltransferase [Pirellulales bacterium]
MRIYTRKGDSGDTELPSTPRIRKNHVQIETLGTMDELNAVLGIARASGLPGEVAAVMDQVQNDLFVLGAQIASCKQSQAAFQGEAILPEGQRECRLSDDPCPHAVGSSDRTTEESDRAGTGRSLSESQVRVLEQALDRMVESLPPVSSFLLPGGSLAAAQLHLARCVCRRAERRLVALAATIDVPSHAIAYLNRLSDLLFVAARYVNQDSGTPEITWISGPC